MGSVIYLVDWKACGCLKNCVCKHSRGRFGGGLDIRATCVGIVIYIKSKSDFYLGYTRYFFQVQVVKFYFLLVL